MQQGIIFCQYMLSKNSGVFFLLYCLKNQDFPLWQRNNHFQYLFFKLIISKWFVMKTFGDESFIYSNDICLHLLKYLHLRGTCKCHKYILPKWQYAAKYNDNFCLFFPGIYTKLKDRNCDIKDRLKLAKFAWFSDKVILPNKEQVLIDFLSGLLLNKKR